MAQKRKKTTALFRLILGLILLCTVVFTAVWAVKTAKGPAPVPTGETETTAETEEPEPTAEPVPVVTEPYMVSSATVASTGDILIHTPLLATANLGGGNYDFNYIFPYITSYFSKYDWMVANLEVPLGGPEAGKYDGYPSFNSPDSLATALRTAGVDMLLYANNHAADKGGAALLRTTNAIRAAGMDALGTRASAEEPFAVVKEINEIPIGMTCYTYGRINESGRKSLNGGAWLNDEVSACINVFDYGKLDQFYAEAQAAVESMRAQGAVVVVFYMHWGNEYQFRQPNSYQTDIAQHLADLGVDIIVGGHPHVIQPVATLTGANGNQTFCVYSTGNAVSNQRREIMDSEPTGHTEDGMIFTFTVEKWSDGTFRLSDVNILPTWVHMYNENGKRWYEIVPLDVTVPDWTVFGMTDPSKAKASYNRTMELVGEGLNAYRGSHGMPAVPTHVD